jgi:hypothetical protein
MKEEEFCEEEEGREGGMLPRVKYREEERATSRNKVSAGRRREGGKEE